MTKISATAPTDTQGRRYHIACAKGDLAEQIVLVGDPDRATRASEFLTEVRVKREHREYRTFTGTYKGTQVSILSTGIGQDNTEIAVIEACLITKNPTFIRAGSCGCLHPEPEIGDLIISKGAVRLDNTLTYFAPEGYPAVADPEVFLALSRACRNKKAPFYVGLTATASSFYGAQGREIDGFPLRYPNLQDDLTRMNVMNFEMEAAALFVLAQIRGLRAGAICATFASRPRNTFIDDEHRLPAEARCVEASLEAFVLLRTMDKERQAQNLPSWLPAEPLAS